MGLNHGFLQNIRRINTGRYASIQTNGNHGSESISMYHQQPIGRGLVTCGRSPDQRLAFLGVKLSHARSRISGV
jgi:hypothetical protein